VVDKTFSSAKNPEDNLLYIITHSFSGRFIAGISHFKHEDEVLFRPGTKFCIDKVEGNTVWMHEVRGEEEKDNVNTDYDHIDDNGKQNDVNDDESFADTFAVLSAKDCGSFDVEPQLEWYPDWYAQVYPEWYYSTVATDVEDCGSFDVEPQLEWYPDWYAQVYPEWYYSTVAQDTEDCGSFDVEPQLEWYPDWYAQVYPEDYSTVAQDTEDCGSFDVEPQLEWYPDWYTQVYPEWYYSTVAPPNKVDEEGSGSVWKDGRRRSARLLAKKAGRESAPSLGSTVDHLGRRRSLRLQQKKQ
jgi:hypothetical protein